MDSALTLVQLLSILGFFGFILAGAAYLKSNSTSTSQDVLSKVREMIHEKSQTDEINKLKFAERGK